MKKLYAFIFAFLFTLSVSHSVRAEDDAKPVRLKFTSTSVTTAAYAQLVASTVKGIKGMSVANSGSAPVKVAFGASGSEVDQLIVPSASSLVPVYYPVDGGYGIRISVISLDQTNSTGELEMNLFYN